MRRREFIAALGGAAIAAPLVARAQDQGRIYRIGFLIPVGRETPGSVAGFDELRDNGFVEGRNLQVVSGSFNVGVDRIAEVAAILVKADPDAIVCGPELYIRALQKITRTVPLVGTTEDMVGEGLVSSLARPGGNTTGLSILSPELDGKRQDLLIEAIPGVRKIVALTDAGTVKPQHIANLQAAARARGVELGIVNVERPGGAVRAVDAAKAMGAEALNFLAASLIPPEYQAVFERVTTLRLPSIHQWPDAAEAGGLVGYGPRFTDMFRQRAKILVKVLRGAKPADIPVEQPTRFELVINLKTAKAIGHEIPANLVLRADKLVE